MSKVRNIFLAFLIGMLFASNTYAAVHIKPAMKKSPADLEYKVGTTNNNLVWAFEADESADSPSRYTVTLDGVPIQGHELASWSDNVDIIVNVDNLALGSYVVVITVNDTGTDNGQAPPATDSATVTVVENVASSTDTSSTTSTVVATTSSPVDNANTDTSSSGDVVAPFLAMLAALFIGIPILKYKDIR